MCNSLHKDSQNIPTEGVGWKLFLMEPKKRLYSLVSEKCFKAIKGTVTWSNNISEKDEGSRAGDGFCFFLDEKEALVALKEWKRFVHYYDNEFVICLKVKYADGIGSHIESDFVEKRVRIALCKKFSLFKKSDKYRL